MTENIKIDLENLRKLTEELSNSVKKAESVREIAEDARDKAEKIRVEIFNKLKEVFEEI